MLHDCKEAKWTPGTPCFNWRRPTPGQSPTADTAYRLCGPPGRGLSLPTPSNGTLAAAVVCAARYGDDLLQAQAAERRPKLQQAGAAPRPKAAAASGWGLFVLGDAPGFASLVEALPGLEAR
eukprot:1339867-Prymnesium_polylepis.1